MSFILEFLYKTVNLSNLINSKENNIFLKKFVNIRKYLYINEHVFKNTFQKNNGKLKKNKKRFLKKYFF